MLPSCSKNRRHIAAAVWIFWFCFTFLPIVHTLEKHERCLVDVPEVIAKKYPRYKGEAINITIDMSNRITHKLSTHIFQIFIQEILGYERIVVNEFDDLLNVETAVDRIHNKNNRNDHNLQEYLPQGMINLEVWIPPEFDTAHIQKTKYIVECGISSPPGRFGWFIPEELDQPIRYYYKNWKSDIREIHWTFLRDPLAIGAFTMENSNIRHILKKNAKEDYESDEYFCPSDVCREGEYIPPQCEHAQCALLLSSYYNATSFVIHHITELKLLVKVIWLGPNLKNVADVIKRSHIQNNNGKSIIILNWTPSDVILREEHFISVAFKNCELLSSTPQVGCKYEMNRLVKFAWSKLHEIARPLSTALNLFKIMGPEYEQLINLYENSTRNGQSIRDVACQWLKENTNSWTFWRLAETKPKIYIGGIFPLVKSSYNGFDIVKASNMAAKDINRNSSILPNYDVQLLVGKGDCRADSVMKTFIDYITDDEYYSSLVGVLGPACSDTVEPIAGVSKHYRVLVMSYSAEGASFSDRTKYPYFFRTIGENINYKYVYLELFKTMGWKRVAALTEDGQKYTEYISHMQELLKDNKITFIANTKFPRERQNVEMTWYLEDFRKKMARIIIADIMDNDARSVMCAAYKLNMTPSNGYVWFLPVWLNSTWYNTDFYNTANNENVNCTTAEMIKAITGYFAMSHAYFAADDDVMQLNMTVAEWKERYQKEIYSEPSNYAGFAYDAVWTYAIALDKMIEDNPEVISHLHSLNTTRKLVKFVEQTDFNGVSGRIKFPRGNPSRYSIINLMEWYDNETHIIGSYTPNVTYNGDEITGGVLKLDWPAIKWFTPDGKKPDDGTPAPPTCALDRFAKVLNVECEMAVVILNILVAILLILFVIGVVVFVKRRYDKKVQITKAYMKSLGINLLNPQLLGNLDKWEVERERVIINRKIGEGAFGTVYGGEANIPNVGWVAVAVKTLKKNSRSEEKLDFLSEAEVMKRFDHKNIVKLLAVCTKEEPIYAIMEFMLYGDLKTYLLARRNLAKSNDSEESEEVSSKKLTNMALDVARGLSYIAEMKYVHRDLASRNCLVDRNRMVKLGDFGMTRAMFENDYYRFHRKGMLPVRWMSPESLICGVFTPASDVWSFGVLMYEIVTFGGFPFQGHSNAEVVDLVKSGATITPPVGVNIQLEGLMKSCWQPDPKDRPSAKEIVSFIAENPHLLHSCVDVPSQWVNLENSAQMHLSNQFRKRSSASFKSSPVIQNGGGPPKGGSIHRQQSAEPFNGGVSIPLENCGAKEPLLGRAKSSSSLINFNRIVQSKDDETNEQEEEDGQYVESCPALPEQAMSEV